MNAIMQKVSNCNNAQDYSREVSGLLYAVALVAKRLAEKMQQDCAGGGENDAD